MRHANRIYSGHSAALRFQRPSATVRRALTLVELLVTITIMGLVIAISVPIVKPMMASNKVKSGADLVSGFLAQARNRAIEEGRPVGVTFERILNYNDGDVYPYNGACVVMRQVAEPRPLSGFVRDVRVAVDDTGQINFFVWRSDSNNVWDWHSDSTEQQYWKKLVHDGDQIQFNGQGPKYQITWGSGVPCVNANDLVERNLVAPLHFDASNKAQPALFKVFRKPQPGKVAPTMAPPVALPQGVVVDLDSSGMGLNFYDAKGKAESDGGSDWSGCVRDDFCATDPSDRSSVTIMFSPTGEVDRVYCNDKKIRSGNPNDEYFYGSTGIIPSGPIFLNIGIWERAGFWMQDDDDEWYISNDYLPDESQFTRNYHDMNNYWVTIFPRTGQSRINRLSNNNSSRAASGAINDSRKHAQNLHGIEVQ